MSAPRPVQPASALVSAAPALNAIGQCLATRSWRSEEFKSSPRHTGGRQRDPEFVFRLLSQELAGADDPRKGSPPPRAAWSNHSAWHTQVFMLAFDLVQGEARRQATFESIKSRLFGRGSTPAKCPQPPSAHLGCQIRGVRE